MARTHLQTKEPEALAESVKAGDDRTLARILTLAENQVEGYERVLDVIYPSVGSAWRIGLTGPPGAGKSTLAARIIRALLRKGKPVAYLGVDPSSPFSGGALLGDRVRLMQDDGEGRFFARSLATRGAQGGLSEQTEASVDILDAAGFEVVIVETVGVGQAEIDISNVVDTVVVVLVPESGDEIQAMKAGLLEVGDVVCVNKSDRANAHALVTALRSSIAMRKSRNAYWDTAVVSTSATTDGGVDSLIEKLREHHDALLQSGRWTDVRRERLRRRIETLVTRSWLRGFWTPQRMKVLDDALSNVDTSMPRPYALAQEIISEAGNE